MKKIGGPIIVRRPVSSISDLHSSVRKDGFSSRNERDDPVQTRRLTKTDGPRFPVAVESVGIST